jgi:hypothetical protein
MLSVPRKKKNCFVSTMASLEFHRTCDTVLQKITLLSDNRGYIANLFVDESTKSFLDNIDDRVTEELLDKNSEWFENELDKDVIPSLFESSYCKQRNILLARITDKTILKINNKECEIHDIIHIISSKHFSKRFSNDITISHDRLYIYPNKYNNRWNIKEISIMEYPEINTDTKEDIEAFWENMVNECDNTLKSRIEKIEISRKKLKEQYLEIIETNRMDNEWEDKISKLKHFVQNIIFQ